MSEEATTSVAPQGATCPVCGTTSDFVVRRLPNYVVFECGCCTLHFSDPMRGAGTEWYGGDAQYQDALGAAAASKLRHVYADRLNPSIPDFTWLGPNHRAFLRHRPHAGGRLLDIGCGEGTFLRQAAKQYEVEGIELDAKSAARAAETVDGPVHSVPLEEFACDERHGQYDIVTLFEVLEHLEDPLGALRTCNRLLRRGGVVALSVPNRLRPGPEDPVDWPPNHLTRWTPTAMREALSRANLSIARLYSSKSSPYGYWESSWLLPSRFPALWRAELALRASAMLWFPLWPLYSLTRRPAYGLYVEATS